MKLHRHTFSKMKALIGFTFSHYLSLIVSKSYYFNDKLKVTEVSWLLAVLTANIMQ